MQVLIARMTCEEIETDDTGKYCSHIDDKCKHLGGYWSKKHLMIAAHCNRFDELVQNKRLSVVLDIKDGKPLRCRACLGAQMAAEAEGIK